MMEKILIIEDHRDVAAMLAESLSQAGYMVQTAATGTDGLQKVKQGDYKMVLLDIMLPYMSGDEVLRQIRSFTDIPVIIISAKDMVSVKIDLLKLGADDYITKPFDLGEVTARVESHLRRVRKQAKADCVLTYKDLVLDTLAKRVTADGRELELTAKEYGILALLMENRGRVFTKANLYDIIWQESYGEDDNAVKTHLSNLRRKLKAVNPGEEYIETVWGLGYRLYQTEKV